MKEEELIKKLENIELPRIEVQSHQRRLRVALLQSQYFEEHPRGVAVLKSKMQGGIDTMKGLISWRPVWKPALVGALAIALIVSFALIIPPHLGQSPLGQSPEVLAAEIATNSPEVKAVLGEGEITIMGLRVTDGKGMVICGAKTSFPISAEVDLKAKKVTDIARLPIPELSKIEEEEAISIANAEPKVKELLDNGAIIGKVYPAILSGIITREDWEYKSEVVITKMACVAIELGDESWGILVDFNSRKVNRILKPSPMKKTKAEEPVPPMTPPPPVAQIEEVKNIAKADPRVQELLGQGATISAISPQTIGIVTISENNGNGCYRGASFPVASQDKFEVTIELEEEKHWAVLVNLAEKRVESITEGEWPQGIVYRTSVHRISSSEVPRK